MKRLVLINAYPDKHFGEENISVIVQMPLNLAYIAALTPRDEWEVDIVDETLERAVDENGNLTFGHADLVGITGVTYQAPRMYEIGKACKKAGVPTVAGGAHATIIADEAKEHIDSIVIGESERVWPEVLEDFKRGRMQQIYHGGPLPLDELSVYPDREWLRDKYKYKYSSIITTRGCPFKCDFCCVPAIQGRKYRQRPAESVWAELERTEYRGLMLAEDNFYGYTPDSQERCRHLFKGWAERDLKKNWFGFTSLNVAQDDVVLDYMAKSGCLGILMGIESLDFDTLKKMHKSVNIGMAKKSSSSFLETYKRSFANLHKHGLIVWGSVIFGTDFDKDDTFQQVVDAVWETSMDVCTFGIYTPMVKTELFTRLSGEGRIFRTNFPEDWYYYNSGHLVHQLKSMPLEKFIEGLTYVYNNIYSAQAIRERFKRTYAQNGNLTNAMFAYRINLDWKIVFEANLMELHKMYNEGVYPHQTNPSQVAVPASFEAFNHPQRAKLMSIYKGVDKQAERGA
jgi:radical SAM superfamily enzyme YgiQ (UPF0313 family)